MANIKGITVEINGNTGPLDKALKGVNKTSRDLQSELKSVERLLKFDPTNSELLAQKQQLLSEQVAVTNTKLEQLRAAEQQVQAQFERGDIGAEQYRAFQREIVATEGKLSHYRGQLATAETKQKELSTSVKKLGQTFKEAGTKAKEFGTSVGKGMGAAGAAGATAVGGLVEGMQEYNQDLARLRTNASLSGRDLKKVEDGFLRITEITGESDSAVETMSNLLATGFSDNQLADVIDQVNGAAIKFSDTLKTEGIADGIQETFATGSATGPFSELLSRSGVDLQKFNKDLQDAKKHGEGANFILKTLADQGFGKINEKYKEMNPEVQKNAEANAKLEKSLSDLSLVLAPLIAKAAELAAKIAGWVAKNPMLAEIVTKLGAAIAIVVGAFMALAPIVNVFVSLWSTLAPLIFGTAESVGLLATALTFITGPIGLTILAIVALVAGFTLLWTHCEGFRNFWKNLWEGIKTATKVTVDALANFFTVTIPNAWNSLVAFFTEIPAWFSGLWTEIKTTTENIWNSIKVFFTIVWNGIVSGVMAILNPFIDGIKNIFNSLKAGLTTMFEGYKLFFTGVWNEIKLIFLGPILLICDLVTGNFGKLKTDTEKIFNGLKAAFAQIWNGIKLVFTGVVTAISGFLTMEWNRMVTDAKTIWNGLKTFMSTLWTGIKTTATTAWNGLKSSLHTIVSNIKTGTINIFNDILSFFRNLPGTLRSLGSSAFNGLKSGITSVLSTLGSVIKNGFNDGLSFIKGLPANMLAWGEDMIDGLIRGIKNKIGAVGDAVRGVADKITSLLHFSVPDEGPLKNYESWMPDFMEGLAKGIEKSKSVVTSAIKGLSTDMRVGMSLSPVAVMSSGTSLKSTEFNRNESSRGNLIVEVPLYLDNREIARGTYKHTAEFQNRDNNTKNKFKS